jgi:hypothetical protein
VTWHFAFTDLERLSNGQFLHHNQLRAELPIAMRGVGTDALLCLCQASRAHTLLDNLPTTSTYIVAQGSS